VFSLDTVIMATVANPAGGNMTSPCLVSLLLSGDAGLTYVPAVTHRFDIASGTSPITIRLADYAMTKYLSSTAWYTAAGTPAPVGQVRSFRPPYDHFMLLFGGQQGGTVTASAVADSGLLSGGGSLPTTGLEIDQHFGTIGAAADGATVTFNIGTNDWWTVTLAGNRTLAVTGGVVGQQFSIGLQQDATGSRTVTWFSGIRWAPNGVVPTLTTTATKMDVFTFKCLSAGSYLGFVAGQGM